MALNLSKQKTINLTKSAPSMKEFKIGLSWDADTDLDASMIVLGEDGSRKDIVFYGNLEGKGIKHSGDARDGEAAGDDESITVNLSEVEGSRLIVAITSYSEGSPVTFGAAQNPVAKLYGNGNVLVEAKLDESAAFGTSVEFVEFYKEGSEWQYKNVSETVGMSANGLEDIVAKFQ
ncbi:TerD domain protein [Vibrio phage 1.084.O._10N.261.49.F5]|nr:TerD domain protein [Vibrio phage 1.084.O._10N.261.49.F5]